MLDPGHQAVLCRPQIAPVIGLEELGAEGRHVDLDRALAGACLAGEAAVHRLLDLVREVVLAAALAERVRDPGWKRAPGGRGA